ncbi:MAG TPA: autotransporter-associated beta strand repeat-containing protein [Kiritimatiellia bacterium]|nr:autotransporter-associated beta strand repeat-containing protein [Kiritimatiellia bacterium]
MRTKRTLLCLGMISLVTAACATDRIWTGGSSTDSNWSRPENWGGIVPSAGDALIFGGSARLSNTNDLSSNTAFSGITFPSGAGAFELYGNVIALDGDVCNFSTSSKKLALPLWLTGDRTLFGSNASVTVEGVVGGPGGLCAAVTNTVYLKGDNAYEGLTSVSNGCRLLITHANALGSTNAGIRVYGRTGASLRLQGGITVAEPITLVGQIPPWINCLTAGSGSNIITGPVYKELDASVGTDGGSTLIFRGGVKHVSGGPLYLRHTGLVVFENKPIEFGSSALLQAETAGTTVLAVPGNTFSTLKIANHHKVRMEVDNALPSGCLLDIGGSWDADALLDLNGHDQSVGSIKTDPRVSSPGYLAVTSALPATLTVNQGTSYYYMGDIAGAVSLVKNGSATLTFTNLVPMTTTGSITVNAGKLTLSDFSGGFGAATSFRINGGTLEIRNGATLPDAATVRVLEGAKISIKDGVTETIDKLFLDGEQQVSGTWGATGSGAEHVNDVFFSGLGKLNVVTGTQTTYADAVWDGGGAGSSFSTPENWEGDALPSFDGFARAIFATGGTAATVDAPATFTKVTFNANTNFTVAAGSGTLTIDCGGIKAGAPNAVSRTYTINANIALADHQFWSITNTGAGTTTLSVSGAIADGGANYNLTKRGNGVLILAGSNSYGGVTTIETNYAIIRHAQALGSTNANTVIKDGAYLVVEGGFSLAEPITMAGDASLGWQGTLRSNAGTNTLTAKLTSNGGRLRTNNNGCWEVTGGVDGSGFICTAQPGTYIRFTEKPITTPSFTCHTYGGSVILAVAGNTFSWFEVGGTELRTDVPFAWPATASLVQGSSGSPSSTLNFNGNDQAVGSLRADYTTTSPRITYSVAPMTLTVSQNSDTVYNAMITGAVSIVKLGTGNLSLTNAFNTTSGGFAVSNGTLSVANVGSLGPNSTNIVVGGSGTLALSSTHPSMIADTATVSMPEDGVGTAKISLASGVNEKVGWLFYGNKMLRAGTHGSSSSTATYKDDTHFSGQGVLTVLHDDSGTLIIVQ